MQWRDEGLIIGARRHGETSVIVELMTRVHGRHLGLVRGGRSRRLQPVLQAGNGVDAIWRARLDGQLGTYTIEATVLRAATAMDDATALDAVNLVGALLRLLPEREAHPGLFDAALLIFDHLGERDVLPALIVRFELEMLAELGFGLDLACCAATGAREELVYVSPRSGRAVSRAAGQPYHPRLFALPAFLSGQPNAAPTVADVLSGFVLTGHFLVRDVFEPRSMEVPSARDTFVARLRSGVQRRVGAAASDS